MALNWMHVFVESVIATLAIVVMFAYDRWRGAAANFTEVERFLVGLLVNVAVFAGVYLVANGVRLFNQVYRSPMHDGGSGGPPISDAHVAALHVLAAKDPDAAAIMEAAHLPPPTLLASRLKPLSHSAAAPTKAAAAAAAAARGAAALPPPPPSSVLLLPRRQHQRLPVH